MQQLRTIALQSIAGKAYANVLSARLSEWLADNLLDEQCGFRPSRSTVDALFSLRLLCNGAWDKGQTLHICMLDLTKAFDSVDREMAWQILLSRGAPPKLVTVIRDLHTHHSAVKGFWWQLCAALAMLVRTYPDIHSIIHSKIQSFIHSTIIHSRNHSFLPSGIHPSFHACMHPFIRHSFNCLLYLAAAHQCHYNCFVAADDNHLTLLLFSHSSVALCCCTRVSRNCLIRATFSSQSFKSSNVLTSSTNECSTL